MAFSQCVGLLSKLHVSPFSKEKFSIFSIFFSFLCPKGDNNEMKQEIETKKEEEVLKPLGLVKQPRRMKKRVKNKLKKNLHMKQRRN